MTSILIKPYRLHLGSQGNPFSSGIAATFCKRICLIHTIRPTHLIYFNLNALLTFRKMHKLRNCLRQPVPAVPGDVCLLLIYLYDGQVLPRHCGLLLEEVVGGALRRPHSPDARHGGYPGLLSFTAFGTRTTMFLTLPETHNTTFTALL
jgi:hypothetical protein